MKVGSVFGKVAGKEGTVLLLICVPTLVFISTSQSLSVSDDRDAIFESTQYVYSRETCSVFLRFERTATRVCLICSMNFPSTADQKA